MSDINTLIAILLVILILAEAIALWTNGLVVNRNYREHYHRIEQLEKENARLGRQLINTHTFFQSGQKVQAYLLDTQGLTPISEAAYKELRDRLKKDSGAEEGEA